MSRFLCDVEIAREQFEKFVQWYKKQYPDFAGYIRRVVWDSGVAEIIDGDDIKTFRFIRL